MSCIDLKSNKDSVLFEASTCDILLLLKEGLTMSRTALVFGIIGILTWWIPLGPAPLLIPIWGIILSQEAYQVKDRLAFSLNVTALVLATGTFFFDAVRIIYTTLG